jgi:hypothetical protein
VCGRSLAGIADSSGKSLILILSSINNNNNYNNNNTRSIGYAFLKSLVPQPVKKFSAF